VPGDSALHQIVGELRECSGEGDGLNRYLWFDQKYYLSDDILNKSDRMSMAHSVEVRPPFLDHRIVEFAAKLPSQFKIEGSSQKIILKQLMRSKLPAAILHREKIGFDIPAHEWLRGPLCSLLRDALTGGLAAYPDLFRASVIERLLQRHLEKKVNAGYHLWGLLILFLWMKRWKIQAPAQTIPAAPVLEKIGLST
jgi:asparagine synthase (glutamine-hydrolysing)